MIKPMVVDLEVDATLGDGFYYCSFIHKKNQVLLSNIYTFFFEKSYTRVWNLTTLAHFQGIERYPDNDVDVDVDV